MPHPTQTAPLRAIPVAKKAPRAVPGDADKPAFSPPAHWRDYDLAHFDTWDCEPLVPLVDDIIARGNLVYTAAETQTGKTLFGLYVAQRFLTGGLLFGKYAITPVQTVWYFVLEDPARRVQERVRDVQQEFVREFPGLTIDPKRLIFRVMPGFALNNESMMTWLELELQNATPPPDVIFLDTYQKATPGLASFDDPAQSPILHQLADLTRRRNLTLWVNDHVRKKPQQGKRGDRPQVAIDDIKGTGGKAQNADCVILLQRVKDDRSRLHFRSYSKDFETPVQIELRVAPKGYAEGLKFTWVADLTAATPSAQRRHGRPSVLTGEMVINTLKSGGWMSGPAIAKACGVSPATIRRRLQELLPAGTVISNAKRGKACLYTLPSVGGLTDALVLNSVTNQSERQ